MDKIGSDRSIPRGGIARLQSSSHSSTLSPTYHNATSSRIPVRIEDCAHFHYDNVQLSSIGVTLYNSFTPTAGTAHSTTTTPGNTLSRTSNQPHDVLLYPYGNQRAASYCGISPETGEFYFTALVKSRGQSWLIRRTYTQLKNFDKMLHQCAWDRHVSRLEAPPSIMELSQVKKDVDEYKSFVHTYLARLTSLTGVGSVGFSSSSTTGSMSSLHNQQYMHIQHSVPNNHVACNLITCGPVLNFLEMDNRGHRLIPFCQESEINTPAIAAVHVTRAREPAAKDELQLEVGDIISVIDMPPPKESMWWRGKRGLEVGYFPADCVQVISVSHTPRGGGGDSTKSSKHHLPLTGTASAAASLGGGSARGVGVMSLEEAQKRQPPVLKSRNKLSAVLRTFFTNRPPRGMLRQAGLLQERVFGCDLAEHIDRLARANLLAPLLPYSAGDSTSNREHIQKVPVVVVACCQFVEFYCLHSDGVYRRSGVQSNIQKLRQEFDNMDNYFKSSAAAAAAAASNAVNSIDADKSPADSSTKTNENDVISISSAPFLDRDQYRTDIHCVPSVLKQYFRELPNPLLTHQLFHAFLRVTRIENETERIETLRQTVALLPPPHYQTLKYLMRHLHCLASAEHVGQTSMNDKNLARVWGPNLLRKPEHGSLLHGEASGLRSIETSDVTTAGTGGGSRTPVTSKAIISHPTPSSSNQMTVFAGSRSVGPTSAAETTSLEMMTEVVQGAVIVELMIRQYKTIFESPQQRSSNDSTARRRVRNNNRRTDNNNDAVEKVGHQSDAEIVMRSSGNAAFAAGRSNNDYDNEFDEEGESYGTDTEQHYQPHHDEGRVLRSLSSIDMLASSATAAAAAASNNNNDNSFDSFKSSPFRISFRRQLQQQQQAKSAEQHVAAAAPGSARVTRRLVPSEHSAGRLPQNLQNVVDDLTLSTTLAAARRNKTISMVQTEEFFPHFTQGVKLIPVSDAAAVVAAARSNFNNTLPMPSKSTSSSSAVVRPPSSQASSSYSRDFSDCDDDNDADAAVVNSARHRRRGADDDDVEVDLASNIRHEADNNNIEALVRRQRRHNGKSPERAPSSASRKSTSSQFAASVKKKLAWPFGTKHKKSSSDDIDKNDAAAVVNTTSENNNENSNIGGVADNDAAALAANVCWMNSTAVNNNNAIPTGC